MLEGAVETAAVHLHGHLVGHLWSSHGANRFQPAPEYRELPRRPVLGQVFEERPDHQWRQAGRLPKWFSNLLPEQRLRDFIAEERGINPRNEFRLLLALGADLPGAVEVTPLIDPEEALNSTVEKGVSAAMSSRTADGREEHRR